MTNQSTDFLVTFFQFAFRKLLAGSDRFARADAGAGAAVDADIGVDAVDVAFLDGAGRAFTLASSTSHAEIGIDYVSHNSDSLIVVVSS